MACDFSSYADFDKLLDARHPGDVERPVTLEVAIKGPAGANRLFIFTGAALVQIGASSDAGTVRRGVMRVRLDFPLSLGVRFESAATVAGLASIRNFQKTTLWAVDCVSTAPGPDPSNPAQQVLIVTAALAVQGGSIILPRVAYQANVLVVK